MKKTHADEIAQGERFRFGANWEAFLSTVNDERIEQAKDSLRQMLEVRDLRGKRFLDIGCGSGLFSLAARQLGAEVYSFDNDPQSVACAEELKRRHYDNDNSWTIEEGSVLDENYLMRLGKFHIVYSWGVLHHTGNMMKALENVTVPIAENGSLYIAIYNDKELVSKLWTAIKQTYCASTCGKIMILSLFIPFFTLQSIAIGLIKYQNPFGHFLNYKKKRGMSVYHDWIDWLGGYPFEVAKPEEIFRFYKRAGFLLTNMTTTNRHGCNQFVFKRTCKTKSPNQSRRRLVSHYLLSPMTVQLIGALAFNGMNS